VQIHELDLVLPNLSVAFDGLRVVQISDLHYGTWLNLDLLENAIDQVNRLRPDLVAITGDFISHNKGRKIGDLIAPLGRLVAPSGVFGVLGNHDCKVGIGRVASAIGKAGVRLLQNEVATLEREGAALHLAGIGSWYYRQDRLESVLAQLQQPGAAVLLAHEPDFADFSAHSGRFDLQLSGHSHGGQMVLPRLGPLYLPRCGLKYPAGLYQVNGMIQYTNRGLGTSHLRLRWNCPPEITAFTLLSPDSE
jgi:predicted MPP superfamily phosphohydrolase